MKKVKKSAAILMAFIIALLPCRTTALALSRDSAVSELIMIAEDEVGYTGTRSYSKYGEWYGYQGGWCSTFALWCFNKAGNALGVKLYANIVPSGGNCSSMVSWFSNKGRYHSRSSGYTPQRGDLIFFNWSGGRNAQHVGIVKSVSGSTIYTIEGNCSGKVKEKSYSPSGSRPYASTSSILGYGNPNWAAVCSGSSSQKQSAKAKRTTKSSSKKANRTASRVKARAKSSTASSAKRNSSAGSKSNTQTTAKAETTATTTAPTTKATTKKPAVKAKDMSIHAATNTIQVGDSVKLDYEVKPADSTASVGYFCDEDNIVSVSDKGVITGKEVGTATVVVCANDEIYKQCDFTVTSVNSNVTTKSSDKLSTIPYIGANKANSKSQKLSEMGINTDKLISHKRYFAVPLCIIGATGVTVLCIEAIKAVVKSAKKRKAEKEKNEA